MNVFSFTGNLGRDSEMRTTAGGTSVLSWSVAVKSGFGDNEKTTWVKCVMFGKRAEGAIGSYLVKGQQVAVSGELSLEEWQDQSGQTKSQVSVRVNDVTLVGDRKSGQQQQPAQQQQQPQQGFQNPPPAPQGGFQQQPPQQQGYSNKAPQQPQQAQQAGGFEDDLPNW